VDVLVLADTHLRPDRRRELAPAVLAAAARADVVLHAGDVVTADTLELLARLAPVHAVLGNNDRALVDRLPQTLELDLEGVRVAMIHDSGATTGRARRLHRRFPGAQLVVFGHSHMPLDGPGVDGQRLFNPGSPTERRRAPFRSYGWLELRDGAIARHEIVPVDGPSTDPRQGMARSMASKRSVTTIGLVT
jgi:putative phosphoesterase